MRKGIAAATVAAAATALVLVGSASAMAASPSGVVAPMSKHTGTAGCFNWSWADGTVSTTVYFHNTCQHKETISISWSSGHFVVGDILAGEKAHAQGVGHVVAIDDLAIVS
jgi:hypothetical protein